MNSSGTSRPGRNSHARYSGLEPEALRKPEKLGGGPRFCLTPAGQALVMSAHRLGHKIAKPFVLERPELADRIEHAVNLALIRAAAIYNPNLGYRFTTIAGKCAYHAILNVINHRGPKGYATRAEEAPFVGSLHYDDDNPRDYADPRSADPAEAIDLADRAGVIGTVMARIEPRLADILRRRAVEGETLEAIGEVYGITKERVRQLELRAAMKVREGVQAG